MANSAFNDGTWISDRKVADENISQVELRYLGKDLTSTKFYFSVDGGVNWELFNGKNTLQSPTNVGKNIKAKVEFVKDGINPQPDLNSLAILYS